MIHEKDVTQLYDPVAGTFLADRFVKGTCPRCKAPDQYGDSCEKCGATFSPTDLIDPVSTLSGAKPELRSAKHLFVNIERLHGFLDEWTQSGEHLQPEIANYLKGHFLSEPLRDWDISRPAPYFGFEIPDSPGNYWYVWFDAPIGYIGSTLAVVPPHRRGLRSLVEEPRRPRSTTSSARTSPTSTRSSGRRCSRPPGFSLPAQVHIHGFLTVNGEKMSKTRGTFVRAATYLEHLDPSYLRYYYAAKLTGRVEDLDMNLDEFVDQGERRPGGQRGESGQPHGEVRRRHCGLAAAISRRRRTVRPGRRRRRRDRRGV